MWLSCLALLQSSLFWSLVCLFSLSLSLLSVVPHLKLCLVCVHEQSVGLWFCFCPSQRVFLWPCLVHIAFQSGCGALANGQGLLASIALVACPVMLIARVLHGLSLGLVLSFSKSLCLSQRVSLSLYGLALSILSSCQLIGLALSILPSCQDMASSKGLLMASCRQRPCNCCLS